MVGRLGNGFWCRHGSRWKWCRWCLYDGGRLGYRFKQAGGRSFFQRRATLFAELCSQVQRAFAKAADGRRPNGRRFAPRDFRWLWGFWFGGSRRRRFLQLHPALKAEDYAFRQFRFTIGTQGHGCFRAEPRMSRSSDSVLLRPAHHTIGRFFSQVRREVEAGRPTGPPCIDWPSGGRWIP